MRALTGLSEAEFEQLLITFAAVYQADRQARYEAAVQAGQRQRKAGGGERMMPHRAFQTVEELMQALDGIDQIILDATERAYRRPQDPQQQQEHYSGKKTAYAEEYHPGNDR